MPMHLAAITLSRFILSQAYLYEWSLQGLGMFRLYLNDGRTRLHVWDPEQAFPGASPIHDHPWDFRSYIIAGTIENKLYVEPTDLDIEAVGVEGLEVFKTGTLHCGEGGGLIDRRDDVKLFSLRSRTYYPGLAYWQRAEEIHETWAKPGTITVMQRTFREDRNRDQARVFWKQGEWGSAEPRKATRQEVDTMAFKALQQLQEVPQ